MLSQSLETLDQSLMSQKDSWRDSIAPAASGTMAARKLEGVELLRVVSACGVVWFHVPGGPLKDLGYSGLICFVLISVFFLASGAETYNFTSYCRKRVVRIVPPWVFWFAVYAILDLIRGKPMMAEVDGVAAKVLVGPWVGLWYLPFLLAASLIVFGLVKASSRIESRMSGILFSVVGLCLLIPVAYARRDLALPAPWAQWLHVVPGIPLGIGLWQCFKGFARARVAVATSVGCAVGALCLILAVVDVGLAVTFGVGTALVCAAFSCSCSLPRLVLIAADLCLGVYLCHSLVMRSLRIVFGFLEQPIALFLATTFLSFALIYLLRKNHFLRQVM